MFTPRPLWVVPPPSVSDPGDDATTERVQRLWLVGDRYELGPVLSEGGMGRVYQAVHHALGRVVALKLIHEGKKKDLDSRERFFLEARLASSLHHPNIVSVTDFGVDEEHGYFLVMELLAGESLRQRQRRQELPLRIACDVVDQLAYAVRYMHGRGIIHCDIKPENVFLARIEGERRRNVAKLIDFGLSWRREAAPQNNLGGTPPYVAPERLLGGPPTPSCDVYSLGALLYELIAGVAPYHGGSVMELLEAQLHGPPPIPPSQLARERLDSRADDLILRALARDPAHRQASAEAFHFELRTLMNMSGLPLRKRSPELDGATRTQLREELKEMSRVLHASEAGDHEAAQELLREAMRRLRRLSGS